MAAIVTLVCTMNPSPAAPPFHATSPFADTPLRRAITAATRSPEPEMMATLLERARLPQALAAPVEALARRLTLRLRERQAGTGRAGLVQGLLHEYSLSSQEGVALMCLAEALLRIPDAATRDALIRDKIARGQWQAHLGRSPSLFVNAATWGLLITGRLVATHSETGLSASLTRLVAAGGEPLIRKGVDLAMRLMGEQFVTGETIGEALQRAKAREAEGFRHSYDMLGEAAMTAADARRYAQAYEEAIDAIGQASGGRGVIDGPGISIKLSALHPRYHRAQQERVMDELYPVLLGLAQRAKAHDLGLNIDAEEADRLELSLDLLERLCGEPTLAGWQGLGFVVQAYQKRALPVIEHLIDLARRHRRRLMVRLVKGAYWDSEIKRAQVDGQDDYPVFTRKVHTDVSYLACARALLAAPEAVYPQFATHNAQTLAAVHHLADPARWQPGQYEFQCLHGMGEPLYEQVVASPEAGGLGRPCRIYAPVGTHETLLAYLVRRLLENGANTSFVHRMADTAVPLDELVRDPVVQVEQSAAEEGGLGRPHPAIVLPRELFGVARPNSRGLDLTDERVLAAVSEALEATRRQSWRCVPMVAGDAPAESEAEPVCNPADPGDRVGTVVEASPEIIEQALQRARPWATTPARERAAVLDRAADALEADMPMLMGLLMREAGKTAANAVAEVREAVDFLRFDAAQLRAELDGVDHAPLGPVVCISPWNFPLAIFVGQVAAALAAGNAVLAKPAEQTPLIAAQAVQALWQAGVPREALQLLPGRGETVGARLVADARIRGVLFTGSTEVARLLQRALAGRLDERGQPLPLIAETGGQNAMIVDSSALPEQVVADVLASAFDSAGQRCSALRVLCLQEDVADTILAMLKGAMEELALGRPDRLAVDVGPVIDTEACKRIEAHIETMRKRGRRVHSLQARHGGPLPAGHFVPPTLIEIGRLDELQHEVFGPVLHVLRYRREALDDLVAQINATGYGLTLGLHTRIDETVERVLRSARVGNVYVNRNMIGAVVGVQPFGGEGLSGTGPKAGGPLYLHRLLARGPGEVLARALPGTPAPMTPALQALREWAMHEQPALADVCERLARASRTVLTQTLPGPTGERNTYRVQGREAVLCQADDDADRLVQLAAVLAVGGRAVWPAAAAALAARLPAQAARHLVLRADGLDAGGDLDAVLLHGSAESALALQQALADRPGPVVSLTRLAPGDTAVALERLVIERSVSVNTAAAGGNASLMTLL
jgi:RHH-type transcriptional regulator, proline utilization regulon repressor / proline dehydrogenase / delta 1-pyrroline-5-carboxylate dehydrogenase